MRPHPFLDPANFWPNSIYLIVLSAGGAAILEILTEIMGTNRFVSVLLATAIFSLLTFGIWLGCRHEFKRWAKGQRLISLQLRPKTAQPAQALIALCGPSPADRREKNPAYEAACHHRPALLHLWLITSHSGEETAKWIQSEVAAWEGVQAHTPIVLEDTCQIDVIKVKVESARREAVEGHRIDEAEVMCDFTGMTKPVTAGMILACAPKNHRLEYLQGQYDKDGKLVPAARSVPVEIEIEYQIAAEY